MDFALSANQESIRDAVGKICSRFDDAYWLKKDKEGGYPADFHRALADAGWLGICFSSGLARLPPGRILIKPCSSRQRPRLRRQPA